MSLILEALKKLDREKPSPHRGFLIMAQAAWPSRGGSRSFVLPLLVLGVCGAAFGLFMLRPWRSAPTAPAVPAATSVPTPRRAAAETPRSAPALTPLPEPTPFPPLPRNGLPATGARMTAASPSPRPAPAPDGVRLEAISQRDGRPVAVLNGRLVFEGDSFDGIRVVRIGEADVEVEIKGRRSVIRF